MSDEQSSQHVAIFKQNPVNSCSSSGPIVVEEHDESQCQAMVSGTRRDDSNRILVDNEAQLPEVYFQDSPVKASKPTSSLISRPVTSLNSHSLTKISSFATQPSFGSCTSMAASKTENDLILESIMKAENSNW